MMRCERLLQSSDNSTGAAEPLLMLTAAAASSLCVGKPGAMPSLPDRASVDRLLQQQQ